MSNERHWQAIDQWIDQHFDQQVAFLQALIRVPTDTPPGDNAPHAERCAVLLSDMGLKAERHPVPADAVQAQGMQSITNLIVRQHFGAGPTIALNAHGDVVPPGEGWTRDPYGGEMVDGHIYGRASAVSKSDFATYTFALRALLAQAASGAPLKGAVELHFTYDEEFGGELGPGWLLRERLTAPDLMIAAGFSHAVVTAHNGCLQMEVTVHGKMAHAAVPESGVDALHAATVILQALYQRNTVYAGVSSGVPGIRHPHLNVGRIEGGTNTNVIPGKVTFRFDRRMIPEEVPEQVEQEMRNTVANAAAGCPGIRVELKRLLLAQPMREAAGAKPLVQALQRHAQAVMGEAIEAVGTPLYTDVRLYAAAGIPGVIYGAGPRTIEESHAKQADERLALSDLRSATKVVARTLFDLLS